MTEANREQISCLIDGELERTGRDFLVRRLTNDEELSGHWQRYHVIRACMQREFNGSLDLAERVSCALDAEPAMINNPRAMRWLKPAAGMAIAASVAVMALVGINSSVLEQGQTRQFAEQAGFVSQSTPLDRPFTQPLVPVSLSETSTADRQRLNSYLLRHNQAVGGAGFSSYVPIVVGGGSGSGTPSAPEDELTTPPRRVR
jgi:sigma-E factor negative regulatory protein RseA